MVRRNGSRIAFPGNRKHAAKATKQAFRLARLSSRIRRVYIYHWMPQRMKLPTLGLGAGRPARPTAARLQGAQALRAPSRSRPRCAGSAPARRQAGADAVADPRAVPDAIADPRAVRQAVASAAVLLAAAALAGCGASLEEINRGGRSPEPR